MRLILLLLLPVSFVVACNTHKKTVTQVVILDTITVGTGSPSDIYRETPPRLWDILHTDIALRFNMAEKTADGKAILRLHPHIYPADSLVLDAKSMRITAPVVCKTPEGVHTKYAPADDKIVLYFTRSLNPEDTITISVQYTATPYAAQHSGSSAISDSRGLYFINTDYSVPGKPAQIWTQGETEANSHWVPTIDRPNARSAFRIALTVPDSFRTLSNGALVKSVNEGNMRTDVWEIKERIQIYAAMFAIGKYVVVQDTPWKDREVSYYVESSYEPYAKQIFRHTTEMMDFFSKITGVPYPWNKYSQVVVRDFVSGAMENTTASLFGEFVNQNAREIADGNYEDIVAHELFHHWFGNLVTTESWSHLTLNESFANYGEYLWRKYKYGAVSADEHHFNNLNRYLSSTEWSDPPLVRFHYHSHEDMFDRVSYQKGGRILHYLHSLAGDEAFARAMQLYLIRYAHGSAEAAQWRLAVEEATGLDWSWFFNQWYYRGGHPELHVTYHYDDVAQQLRVTVVQQNDDSAFLYRLPLKTGVIYGDDIQTADWDIRLRKATFTYPYEHNVPPVIVPDITHLLPGRIYEEKKTAHWLVQYRICNDYISKHRAVAHVAGQLQDSSARHLFRLALRDTMSAIRRYAVECLQKQTRDHALWQQQVEWMAIHDGNSLVRAAAFDVMGAWEVKTALTTVTEGVYDSSYSVAGAALAALDKIKPATAYELALELWGQGPRGRLQTEIWKMAGKQGVLDHLSFFMRDWPDLSSGKKQLLAMALSDWLDRVADDRAFESGVSLLARMIITENLNNYRRKTGDVIFELAKSYDMKKKTEQNRNRIAIIREYVQQVILAEQHPEVKRYFQQQQVK